MVPVGHFREFILLFVLDHVLEFLPFFLSVLPYYISIYIASSRFNQRALAYSVPMRVRFHRRRRSHLMNDTP